LFYLKHNHVDLAEDLLINEKKENCFLNKKYPKHGGAPSTPVPFDAEFKALSNDESGKFKSLTVRELEQK